MNRSIEKPSIAILGAGITGLVLAHTLRRKGRDVTVYECSPRPGGVIRSERQGAWLVEHGPNTIRAADPRVHTLIEELGLADRIVLPGPNASKRFIVRGGAPRPLPQSIGSLLLSDLWSCRAKLRLLKEPFIHPADADETVETFFTRRLGGELYRYGIDPFVSGIFAGDPSRLSAQHTFSKLWELEQQHGSIIRGMIRNRSKGSGAEAKRKRRGGILSFDDGLQILTDRLAEQLGPRLKLNATVTAVTPDGGGWKVVLAEDPEPVFHRAVVSTLPADALAKLDFGGKEPALLKDMQSLPYAPLDVLALGFRRDQVRHPLDGFGMLIPSSEPFEHLGILFSSSLFARRAPAGQVLLTCFAGGARFPDTVSLSPKNLLSRIYSEAAKLLGIRNDPTFVHHTRWERAIPQYTMAYGRYLNDMKRIEGANPGFHIRGNIRGGVSLPDRIDSAIETAEAIPLLLPPE